jgi:hypothetical protein
MFRLDVAQRYLAHLIAGVLISVAIVIVALGGAVLESQAFL